MTDHDFIDKKSLSERDICTKFITPAIRDVSGWNNLQFFEEFTLGKIHVRGKRVARGVRDRADYILFYKKNLPLAIIEAKDNNHEIGAGMQQALRYSEMLDIPFAQTRLLAEQLSHSRTELDRLNESALANLLASETPEEFNQRWCFIAEHFDLLTSALEHIAPLRQSILELAVRGKLTQRDAGDELAKELLKRIKEEKDQALHNSELRYVKEYGDFLNNLPFEVPLEWAWCRAQDLFYVQSGNAFKSQEFITRGIRLVRNVNIGHGSLTWKDVACLPVEQAHDYEKFRLNEGDILISLDRPIINAGLKVAQVSTDDLPCLLVQRVGRVIFWSQNINPKYIYLWFLSSLFVDSIDPGRSKDIPHISQNDITKLYIPLPPLAEQARIVKRVEQLLGWCDALEAQLKSAEEERGRLVESVLAGVGGHYGE